MGGPALVSLVRGTRGSAGSAPWKRARVSTAKKKLKSLSISLVGRWAKSRTTLLPREFPSPFHAPCRAFRSAMTMDSVFVLFQCGESENPIHRPFPWLSFVHPLPAEGKGKGRRGHSRAFALGGDGMPLSPLISAITAQLPSPGSSRLVRPVFLSFFSFRS